MPVYLDCVPSSELLKKERVRFGQARAGVRESAAPCIDIGIVNNMPDMAMKSTERQFLQLLDSAAGELTVNVKFYALSGVPRSERAKRHIESFYTGVENLWDRSVDGLIVTGAEPRTSNLRHELYWNALTGLMDWAEYNTSSSIWSCLAAHAAVLHLDGIPRCPLAAKRFGLFPCMVNDHSLTANLPSHVVMPHSRWNDLPEHCLLDSGYELLARSDHAGADTFVKRRNSLFVFFQGHPEYEANTLFLEYRRDVGRYLSGERETYPSMPENCVSPRMANTLEALQARAERSRRKELLADFPAALIEQNQESSWFSTAACIYRNWLNYLCQAQERQTRAEVAPAKRFAQMPRHASASGSPF